MITAYIDESGNLGRGGNYFVLAAIVYDNQKGENRVKRIIKKEQQLLAKENQVAGLAEIKSCSLSFAQRQRILNKIVSRADNDIYYLAIYKKNVTLLNQDKPKNLVYNYFAKILTDMIFAKYNDDFRIIFDQRSTCVKSMNSLPDYIKIGAYTNHNHADKNVEVTQRDSKTLFNLQAADIIAGTVYHAYKNSNIHFLNMIKPRVVKKDEFPRNNFEGTLL
ncbi:MAG: DUF3800 domain-containing protein [Candidatus Saccharibacteria bacterium]|nr:DUF3800 domain-containing protein [Candidatus Saccharibacteria bacterium]